MDRRTVVAVLAAGVMVLAVVLAVGIGHRPAARPDASGTAGGRPGSSDTGAGGVGTTRPPGADAARAGLVGPGCTDYLAAVGTGPGSVAAIAGESLMAALAGNPLLRTFDRGVTGGLNPKVDLAQTIHDGNLTLFAPIDSAYAAMPSGTLQQLTTTTATWRKALSYLIVRGRLDPSHVVGTHPTLAGSPLVVRTTAGGVQVAQAHVVCGGLRTRDATVYLLDAVPLPGGPGATSGG